MITKFNTYNESISYQESFSNEMYHYLYSILPKKTSISLNRYGSNELRIYNMYAIVLLLEYDFNDKEFSFICNYTDKVYRFREIDDLKNHIKRHFKIIYSKFDLKYFDELQLIPVLDTDKYSEFIYKAIIQNPDYISDIKDIQEYLNQETLNKLKHYIDANNFDLI